MSGTLDLVVIAISIAAPTFAAWFVRQSSSAPKVFCDPAHDAVFSPCGAGDRGRVAALARKSLKGRFVRFRVRALRSGGGE
jgi:hypothetical protein